MLAIAATIIVGGAATYYVGKAQRVIRVNTGKDKTELGQSSISGVLPDAARAGNNPSVLAAGGGKQTLSTTPPDTQDSQALQATMTDLEDSLKSKDLELQNKTGQLNALNQTLSELDAKQAQSNARVSNLEAKLKSVQVLTAEYQSKIDDLDKQIAAVQAENLKNIMNSQGQALSLSAMSKLIADASYQIDQLDAQKDQVRREFDAKLNALGIS